MRAKVAAAMMALALLMPLCAGLIVSRCFDLSMEQARESALSEEAAVARAIALEISSGDREKLFSVAQGIQARYGSDTLDVMLVYNGMPMAGASLPQVDSLDALLAAGGRATLLDGVQKTLYIAHAIGEELVLLLGSDVSELYAMRRELTLWAGLLCGGMLLLSGAFTMLVSGWLVKPVRLLAQQRQELIDALAHEMRTPLTALLGGTRLLAHASLPLEKRTALLDTMAREAQRLSDMDERLLMLTRLEHAGAKMEPFSSMEMAKEALCVFEDVVLCGEDAVFTGERELTIQLIRNLVVNAQRAGGETPVQVTLRPDGFSVADTGCGMTSEQISHAFEPFYKADKSRTRSAGGAGLGLSICKKIAQLHGGKLTIDSELGRGTTVVYRFETTR